MENFLKYTVGWYGNTTLQSGFHKKKNSQSPENLWKKSGKMYFGITYIETTQ